MKKISVLTTLVSTLELFMGLNSSPAAAQSAPDHPAEDYVRCYFDVNRAWVQSGKSSGGGELSDQAAQRQLASRAESEQRGLPFFLPHTDPCYGRQGRLTREECLKLPETFGLVTEDGAAYEVVISPEMRRQVFEKNETQDANFHLNIRVDGIPGSPLYARFYIHSIIAFIRHPIPAIASTSGWARPNAIQGKEADFTPVTATAAGSETLAQVKFSYGTSLWGQIRELQSSAEWVWEERAIENAGIYERATAEIAMLSNEIQQGKDVYRFKERLLAQLRVELASATQQLTMIERAYAGGPDDGTWSLERSTRLLAVMSATNAGARAVAERCLKLKS